MKFKPKNQHDITPENYFSEAVGKRYLSSHALMSFLKDPSTFWLKTNGYLKGSSSESADAGRLFHAFMESEEAFKEELAHLGKSPFTKLPKGSDDTTPFEIVFGDNAPEQLNPKATFKAVWDYINQSWEQRHTIWNDDSYDKETILTGQFLDAHFKGRLDCLKIEDDTAYIYDYKTLTLKNYYGSWRDSDGYYHEKTFIQDHDYDLQMAIYAELVKQNYPEVKDVYITFGVLIKGGKHDFVDYPTSFINTKPMHIETLIEPRFNGKTAYDILMDDAQMAYRVMQMDEDAFIEAFGGDNLFLEMLLKKGNPLSAEKFKLS